MGGSSSSSCYCCSFNYCYYVTIIVVIIILIIAIISPLDPMFTMLKQAYATTHSGVVYDIFKIHRRSEDAIYEEWSHRENRLWLV
jgi:hypothetical protein